jgi:hypothetical protein
MSVNRKVTVPLGSPCTVRMIAAAQQDGDRCRGPSPDHNASYPPVRRLFRLGAPRTRRGLQSARRVAGFRSRSPGAHRPPFRRPCAPAPRLASRRRGRAARRDRVRRGHEPALSLARVVQKTLTLTAKTLSNRALPESKSATSRVWSARRPDATCSEFRRRVRSIAVADRSISSKLPRSRRSQTSEAATPGCRRSRAGGRPARPQASRPPS